ncbi:MAG: formylglycine-generating enzyme family protein [Verrucomicrobiae bacterium]|nr:formylglycine-generating enzyme family protein [Verrucomicrobiae bacterium]MCP5538754.1 formylglycine-generating enzyme family protein [Akkermansiaceae bacterium]MCP5549510.1 formylglycine-generating enzyme family protein [Akkermansiaceae bacterium]
MNATRIVFLPILVALLAATAAGGPEPKPGDTVTNSVGMKLAFIPPGRFTMGSPDSEPDRIPNEKRSEAIFEKGFRIGVTEVTQKQWREVMGTDPSFFKGDDRPVEHITWHEAREFCARLGEKEKKRCRLPSEAEWEYACRAGTVTAYNTGKDKAALGEAGWYLGNSGNQSHPVGLKKPNAWGLHDMHGNVSEWCAERPESEVDHYDTGSAQLEREENAGRDHRGGSWGLGASDCRSAARHRNSGNYRYFDLGFRVLCEVE